MAMENAATVVAMAVIKEREVAAAESSVRGEFLDDLAQGSYGDEAAAQRRARHLGYPMTGHHVLVVVDVDGFGAFARGKQLTEEMIQSLKREYLRRVSGVVKRNFPRALVGARSDSVLALLPLGAETEGHEARVRALGQQVREAVGEWKPGFTVSVGFSAPTLAPAGISPAHREVRSVMETLTRFGRHRPDRLRQRAGRHRAPGERRRRPPAGVRPPPPGAPRRARPQTQRRARRHPPRLPRGGRAAGRRPPPEGAPEHAPLPPRPDRRDHRRRPDRPRDAPEPGRGAARPGPAGLVAQLLEKASSVRAERLVRRRYSGVSCGLRCLPRPLRAHWRGTLPAYRAACGMGFVATPALPASHRVVELGTGALAAARPSRRDGLRRQERRRRRPPDPGPPPPARRPPFAARGGDALRVGQPGARPARRGAPPRRQPDLRMAAGAGRSAPRSARKRSPALPRSGRASSTTRSCLPTNGRTSSTGPAGRPSGEPPPRAFGCTSPRSPPGRSSSRALMAGTHLADFYLDLREPRLRERPGRLPPALLDQHDARLAQRPALPDAGPQRRDQHPERQPQLDAGPRALPGGGAPRRRLAGGVRLGLARQRPRAAGPARLRPRRGADDAGPRRLGGPRRPRSQRPRLLPLPVHPLRALGRTGRARLQRRRRRRRGARPQRAPAAPLPGDRRRPGGRGVGGRRRPARPGPRHRAGQARPRPADPRRHLGRLHPARRRGQGTGRSAAGVRRPRRPPPPPGAAEVDRLRRGRAAARPAAGPRLGQRGRQDRRQGDGRDRPRGRLLDGRRHPDRDPRPHPAAGLQLPPAALRAGDQPAHRLAPRALRDVAPGRPRPAGLDVRRPGPEAGAAAPARAREPDPRRRRAEADPGDRPGARRHLRRGGDAPRRPRAALRCGRGGRGRDPGPERPVDLPAPAAGSDGARRRSGPRAAAAARDALPQGPRRAGRRRRRRPRRGDADQRRRGRRPSLPRLRDRPNRPRRGDRRRRTPRTPIARRSSPGC